MDKANERRIVQQFAKLYDDFPKGKLIASESPDFLVRPSVRKLIGIELTELAGQDFVNHTGSLLHPTEVLDRVQETIAAKEEKLVLYRQKKLFEIWLLIHVQTLTAEINFNVKNKLENFPFNSGFDRVFLLEAGKPLLVELTD